MTNLYLLLNNKGEAYKEGCDDTWMATPLSMSHINVSV